MSKSFGRTFTIQQRRNAVKAMQMEERTEPHYYQPNALGDGCVWCTKPEKERPHVAVPSAWKSVIGTLAHNREGFTPKEITEYTAFDRHFIGRDVCRVLITVGYVVQPVPRPGADGRYSLTPRGWAWIEAKDEPQESTSAVA